MHHLFRVGLLLLLFYPLVGRAAEPPADNVERVRQYWQKVWSEGQLEGVPEFYHPACQHGAKFTIEGFQRNVSRFRAAFPDLHVTIDDIFAVGDRVVARVTYRGTHLGTPMFGQAPRQAKIEVPGIDIFTLRDGKCVEHQHVADHLELVLQMGLTLTPTKS